MIKIILLAFTILLTSCFYSEMRVDYTVEGYDESEVFCWADYPYTQEEVGDSVVPYYRYFLISIRNPEKYGLSLSNNVDGKKSDEKYFLVDEYGKKVDLSVTLKIENTAKEIGLDSIIIKPDEISNSEFFVKVLTPSIPSYEIEFKFEKKDGSAHVFNFKVNQERKNDVNPESWTQLSGFSCIRNTQKRNGPTLLNFTKSIVGRHKSLDRLE